MQNLELEAARAAVAELSRQLRETQAAAAAYRYHLGRIDALLDGWGNLHPNVARAFAVAAYTPGEHEAGRALLDRLVSLESRTARPELAGERYPLGPDQPAQIDCRVSVCRWNRLGVCANVSPALTIHEDGQAYCWSKEIS